MSKLYHLVYGRDLAGLARAVEQFLSREWLLETQVISLGGGDLLVQARPRGKRLRRWLGFGRVAAVLLEELGGDQVSVAVGSCRWLDAAPPAMVALWPIDAAAGLGIKSQEQLCGGVEAAAARYLFGRRANGEV